MKLSMTTAIHQHDCPDCIHLGVVVEMNADLYVCPKSNFDILARYSDIPSDYSAWPSGIESRNELLKMAKRAAKDRNII